ncbi:hypothetical protein Tco_0345630 [Tanacetum coccineum]
MVNLVTSEGWKWPKAWLLKAPNLGATLVPNLITDSMDITRWRDQNGLFSNFSVKRAWEALRPRGDEVWTLIRHLAKMEVVQPTLHDIISYLQPLANLRSVKSIVGRLLFAASSYFVWIERNNRLFKKARRSPEEVRDIIMVTVHLKLITFRFKCTANVDRLLARWKMPSNFRFYGN